MNEHGFIRGVHTSLATPGLRIWKIRDQYQGGVPDAFYCGGAGTLWIEYKYVPSFPVRLATPIKTILSELQIGWLESLRAASESAWLVVGIGKLIYINQNHDLRTVITKQSTGNQLFTRKQLVSMIQGQCKGTT